MALVQASLMLAGQGPHHWTLLMMAIGVTLFAYGLRGYSPPAGYWMSEGTIASAATIYGARRGRLFLGLGTAALLILVFRLARGSTAARDMILWIIGIAALTVPFVFQVSWPTHLWKRYGRDSVFVISLMALFLVLNIHDLSDWYYSAIGDEYSFYEVSNSILDRGLERPFSQRGVYDNHPMLNSAYQALVMRILGQDVFGWRMASVLSILFAIPGLHVLARALANRQVAFIATMLFSLSHYLFAYAHIGYNTVHSIAPTIWALACFVLGLQKRSAMLLFAAGLIAGLGFYTHFSARAIMPIIVLFVLTESVWRKRLKALWSFYLGFIITAAMILVVSQAEVITGMLTQVPGSYSQSVTGGVAERILANLSTNLIAFNFNPDQVHFVSGALLDPLTAVLAVLGIGLALANLRNPSCRLLVIWALVSFAATGLLSPYPKVAISRLNYIVPVLAILASLAAIAIWDTIVLQRSDEKKYRGKIAVAATLLFLVVLALNVKQFWFDTPGRFHLSQEAIAIGALDSEACGPSPVDAIIVIEHARPLLQPALAAHMPNQRLPTMIDHDDLTPNLDRQAGSARCVIFAHPDHQEAQEALQTLQRLHPDGEVIEFSGPEKSRRVTIFAPG